MLRTGRVHREFQGVGSTLKGMVTLSFLFEKVLPGILHCRAGPMPIEKRFSLQLTQPVTFSHCAQVIGSISPGSLALHTYFLDMGCPIHEWDLHHWTDSRQFLARKAWPRASPFRVMESQRQPKWTTLASLCERTLRLRIILEEDAYLYRLANVNCFGTRKR